MVLGKLKIVCVRMRHASLGNENPKTKVRVDGTISCSKDNFGD